MQTRETKAHKHFNIDFGFSKMIEINTNPRKFKLNFASISQNNDLSSKIGTELRESRHDM